MKTLLKETSFKNIVFNFLIIGLAFLSASSVVLLVSLLKSNSPDLSLIQLPPGFNISMVSLYDVTPQQITVSTRGNLYVGTTSNIVFILTSNNGTLITSTFARNSSRAISLYKDSLLVATEGELWIFPDIDLNPFSYSPAYRIGIFPASDEYHNISYISIDSSTNLLYIAVWNQSNFNSSIQALNLTDIQNGYLPVQLVANGVSLPSGLVIETTVFNDNSTNNNTFYYCSTMFFTDTSSSVPAGDITNILRRDEVNNFTIVAASPSSSHCSEFSGLIRNFGYPECFNNKIPDPRYNPSGSCNVSVAPMILLDSHVNPRGMALFTGDFFPSEYRGNFFIAETGSLQQFVNVGFRVTRVDPIALTYQVFMDGFLNENEYWGRPYDITFDKVNQRMWVSDSMTNSLYMICYSG